MTRAATTLADPCTGAPRRDFLLGLRHGQLAGAQVPSWCSRHGWTAGCSHRVGPSGQLTTRRDQTPQEGIGWTALPLVLQAGRPPKRRAVMTIETLGIDIAKNVF